MNPVIRYVVIMGPTKTELVEQFHQYIRTLEVPANGRPAAAELSLIKASLQEWEQRLHHHQAISPQIRTIIDRYNGIIRCNELVQDIQVPERDRVTATTGQPQEQPESWMTAGEFEELTDEE